MVAKKEEKKQGEAQQASSGEGVETGTKEVSAKIEAKKAAAEAGRARAKKAKEEAASAIRIAAAGETRISPVQEPRLKTLYQKEVVPELMKELGLENLMAVPRLSKIVINCAVKDSVANPKTLDAAFEELMLISGQKPVMTRAKKAIAAFKVRAGNAVGVRVTLRRARMYEFLDRLVNVVLPRVRDFKGISAQAFDGRGNYSLGIQEQIIFPEIQYDRIDKVRGMTVTLATTAPDDTQARALLVRLGMPFKK